MSFGFHLMIVGTRLVCDCFDAVDYQDQELMQAVSYLGKIALAAGDRFVGEWMVDSEEIETLAGEARAKRMVKLEVMQAGRQITYSLTIVVN